MKILSENIVNCSSLWASKLVSLVDATVLIILLTVF
jgi:hypothetical protein